MPRLIIPDPAGRKFTGTGRRDQIGAQLRRIRFRRLEHLLGRDLPGKKPCNAKKNKSTSHTTSRWIESKIGTTKSTD
jgi:hypothetical protein